MSTDIKLRKAQISKIIQAAGSFGSCLGNLGSTIKYRYSFRLRQFAWISNKFNFKCNKYICQKSKWKRSCQSRKRTYFISNEDMNDIIQIIKSLEDLGVLIDGVTETVKHEIKKED